MTHDAVLTTPPTPPGALKLRRLTLGLTQRQLGAVSGVSREQITRLECGRSVPTWPTVVRLAEALDAEPGELFPTTTGAGGR